MLTASPAATGTAGPNNDSYQPSASKPIIKAPPSMSSSSRSAASPPPRATSTPPPRASSPSIAAVSRSRSATTGEYLFDVDQMTGATRLHNHLHRLPARPDSGGRYSAVVIGAGFTGIEVACGLVGRLSAIAGTGDEVRVVLVERQPVVGPELGEGPQPQIEESSASSCGWRRAWRR